MAIFSKFFGDLMSHIIREYANEEMKYFLYTLPSKIMGILLSVFLVSSLYIITTFNVRGLSQVTFALRVGRWSEKRIVCYIKRAN